MRCGRGILYDFSSSFLFPRTVNQHRGGCFFSKEGEEEEKNYENGKKKKIREREKGARCARGGIRASYNVATCRLSTLIAYI